MVLRECYTGPPYVGPMCTWEPSLDPSGQKLCLRGVCGWTKRLDSWEWQNLCREIVRAVLGECRCESPTGSSCSECENRWNDLFTGRSDPGEFGLSTIVFGGKKTKKAHKQPMCDAVNHYKFQKQLLLATKAERNQKNVSELSPWCASRLSVCIEAAKGCVQAGDSVPDVGKLRVGTVGHMVFECMLLHARVCSVDEGPLNHLVPGMKENDRVEGDLSVGMPSELTDVTFVRSLRTKKRFATAGLMQPLEHSEMLVQTNDGSNIWVF